MSLDGRRCDVVLHYFPDETMNTLSRITIDPHVCHGKPCLRGLRYPVSLILDLLASGMTQQEILADYADLEADDIKACLLYAAKLSDVKTTGKAIA